MWRDFLLQPHATRCLALSGWLMLALSGWLMLALSSIAADFNVTTPGEFYSINGVSPNPSVTVVRGQTYTFAINAGSTHPFRIGAPAATLSTNNITQGVITFTVPTTVGNYSYTCSRHSFGNFLVSIPPPTIRILDVTTAETNLTIRSSGTNNWRLLPQFATELAATNWFNLSVETNRFSDGTNETICGRPPGSNLFLRMQSFRN